MKDFKQLYNRILIFNVILLLGIIALFVLYFTGKPTSQVSSASGDISNSAIMDTAESIISERIAVVKLDTLLLEYRLAQDLNEDLLERQKNAESTFQNKMMKFEKDYTAFQKKMETGAFLSQASMEAQQQDLLKQQNDLQMLQENLTMQLAQNQEQMTQRLYDSVIYNIELINKDRFVLILGDAVGTNVLYSNQAMDITNEVLRFLNLRYQTDDEK
ncbi:MAG: OmpH family outer membrane protein [Bacteroidales bacterium]|jgi:outer membrane protein|nr:OmpH family outer membrane protein [Bacteroidales bacterium]